MGSKALVRALVAPTGTGTKHILTVAASASTMSTAIDVGAEGELDIELPAVLRELGALLGSRTPMSMVLRTFGEDIAFTLPNGVDIPVKTVRCWFVADGVAYPRTEAETFAAFCTDAESGELIPPERGVQYADAWTVDFT